MKLSKDKAIELIDTGLAQGLASFFQNSAAVITGGTNKGQEELRLLRGLDAFFWSREQAVKAIEEGKISGVEAD